MLRSKIGLIINGVKVDRDDFDFAKLAHSTDASARINVPKSGVPLVADSKILREVYCSGPVNVSGVAMRKAVHQSFEAHLFNKGIVIETISDRLRYLKFIISNSNKTNKARAQHQYDALQSLYKSNSPYTPIFIGIVDDDGIMYTSSTGVLLEENVNIDKVLVDGKSAKTRLYDFLSKHGVPDNDIKFSIENGSIRKVPVIDVHVAPSVEEVKQAVSLLGMLLTIRGFHIYERSAANVVSEWNLVAQPLLNYIKDAGFSSFELPWAISSFKGLDLSLEDKLRANLVAPYLTCNLGVLSTSSSSPSASNVRFISALKEGKWVFSNNTYSVQIGSHRAFLDPMLNDMVQAALSMNKQSLDKIASQLLEAAAIYGKAAGDGTLWATSLYCEWLGVTGILGGLAINLG